jgi:glucosylceramidase
MRTTLLFFILCCLLGGALTAQTVTPFLTQGNQGALLAQQPTIECHNETAPNWATITINSNQTFQPIDGFGFTMTQGSAQAIRTLNNNRRNQLMQEFFGTNGIANSMVRISIGASDLSNSTYTYNETSGDTNMNNFSLNGPDLQDLIPVLKQALQINPNLKVLATPWTAPTWMKEGDTSAGGYRGGSLQQQYYAAYALYFVRYLQAMRDEEIDIWGITPQNEPENPFNVPSMAMTADEQVDFINNHLGPQIRNAGFNTRIIGFDHNCDNTAYPTQVANSSSFVAGSAFHLYEGNISAMDTVRNNTNKPVYFTEQYTDINGSFDGDLGWHMENVVIGSLNNWSQTVFSWNLASFPESEPRTDGGCTDCLGAVTIENGNYQREVSYYIIGHVSKFIRPGARRISSSDNNDNIFSTAFRNPNGDQVVVAYNSGDTEQAVRVQDGSRCFDYDLPGRSAVTFIWTPGHSGDLPQSPFAGVIDLPGMVEAENFDEGGPGVAYSDNNTSNFGGQYRTTGVDIDNASEGGFNVGWIEAGEWLEYTVNVASAGTYDFVFRVASLGTSGQLNVAFNGANRTGSVDIPNTGGWQSWSNVTVNNISLNAGQQTMRINFTGGDFNLNKVTVNAAQNDSGNLAGFYNIFNRGTGRGLDVANNSTVNNSNVHQWDISNGGGDNQRWEFEALNNGYYRIKVKHTGRCLSQYRNNQYNVVQQNCQNISRQQWDLQPVGSSEFFRVVNRVSGRRLQVDMSNGNNNGANVESAPASGGWNQQWRFELVGNSSNLVAGPQVQSEVGVLAEQVELFPNPVDDEVTVNLPTAHTFNGSRLFDAAGRLLLEKTVRPAMTQLGFNLKALPPGLYFIHFNSPTGSVVKRLVKK